MGIKKYDLRIQPREKVPSNDGRVSIAVPKDVETKFYKIPAEERNELMRQIIIDFVKENAT